MKKNIAQATDNGRKMKDLENQTEHLEESGKGFYKTSGDVKKMFQWKAFLWQLAFAGIILLILSGVTLYILSATGVLNNRGRSSPSAPVVPLVASSPPTEAPLADPTSTLFSVEPGIKAFQQPKNIAKTWFAAGEECPLGDASGRQCGEGLVCMAQAGGAVGVCRPAENSFPTDRLVQPAQESSSAKQVGVKSSSAQTGLVKEGSSASESKSTEENSSGCGPGEVACSAALAASGTPCIIGRCIIRATPASDNSASKQQPKSKEPVPSSPLTGTGRVYQSNGEDPSKTEAEIVEALVTLHQHAADCSAGILHKDCTLELMMQSWGVW